MTCKGICVRYKAQKPVGTEDMLLDKEDAKFAKYSSNGKVYGVHVVDID